MLKFSHKPVMLNECMEGLALRNGGIWYDGTVGGGGHSYEILKRTSPNGRLIATDLDDEAIAAASERLKEFDGRFEIYKSNYKDFSLVFERAGVEEIDGALLDFGVSSHQLDDCDRGFTYRNQDAPLDMRMNTSAYLTAEIVLNTYSEADLTRILKTYGEETFAKQIARNVVKYREKQPLKTSGEFAEIIKNSIPAKFRFGAPCERKSFQAIRIAVNDELGSVERAMEAAIPLLNPGGRLAVITFHSLEDRIVKNAMAEAAKGCTCPPSFPVCVCGKKPLVKLISRKPIIASDEELEVNPRSRSAKLRVCEKL